MWTGVHDHLHIHRLWNDEDVGEDNCSIHQPRVSTDWLEGDFAREVRCPAGFEKNCVSHGQHEILGQNINHGVRPESNLRAMMVARTG